MRPNAHQVFASAALRIPEPRILLLALATGALIVCDLVRLTVPTGIAAAVLAVVVALYYTRRALRWGIYAFIIAELSPISLTADVAVALAYQAFALMLLTALLTPFPIAQKANTYGRPLLITLLICAIALAAAVVTGVSGSTAVRATSLAAVVIIALGGTLIVIERNFRTLMGA